MAIIYRTKDLNEAAFIWCQPLSRLVAIEPEIAGSSPPELFYFRFQIEVTDEELKTLIFSYANEETKVEPQIFARKQNNLRDRLYSARRKFVAHNR